MKFGCIVTEEAEAEESSYLFLKISNLAENSVLLLGITPELTYMNYGTPKSVPITIPVYDTGMFFSGSVSSKVLAA